MPELENKPPPVIEWLMHDDLVIRECFAHAASILQTITGADHSVVMLLEGRRQYYQARFGREISRIERAQSLCKHVELSEQLFIVEDVSPGLHYVECTLIAAPHALRFYAGARLRAPDGSIVGALCSLGKSPRRLNAGQRSAFVHLRQMVENTLRLRMATATDSLTNIFSRRLFVEKLKQKWSTMRADETLGVGIIDVDWFKQYNDTYGHILGDDCLKHVATVLQSLSDCTHVIAGRIGGEEFGLIVDGAALSDIENLAERIRARVQSLQFEHKSSPKGIVTVSIGIAVSTKEAVPDHSCWEALSAADRALYVAKNSGRNKVVAYTS
jgi:diguanylate cyclase (GGDEF)-like protein